MYWVRQKGKDIVFNFHLKLPFSVPGPPEIT